MEEEAGLGSMAVIASAPPPGGMFGGSPRIKGIWKWI